MSVSSVEASPTPAFGRSRLLLLLTIGCASGAAAPAHPRTPVSPTHRELEVPAEGLTLAGTLSLPAATSPVPGVLLVHGSGPNSRHQASRGQLGMGFGVEVATFDALAAGLVERGIAVLRYDKRSCGPFNGCADNGYPPPSPELRADAFVDDAALMLDALGVAPEVDAARLFVVGHSQGATFVPLLAEARPALAAGVMLAAAHRPIDALLGAQRDLLVELLTEQGAPAEAIAQTTAPLDAALAQLQLLRAGTLAGDTPVLGAPALFWRSMIVLGERAEAAAQAVATPLLLVGGSYDWNVPLTEREAWETTLEEAGGPRTFRRFEGMTHALNWIAEPDRTQLGPADIGAHVHAPLLDALAAFVRAPR